jgi:hypothetical protein
MGNCNRLLLISRMLLLDRLLWRPILSCREQRTELIVFGRDPGLVLRKGMSRRRGGTGISHEEADSALHRGFAGFTRISRESGNSMNSVL